jgi:pimeloyl-ACP methyl ester carboxylesterase
VRPRDTELAVEQAGERRVIVLAHGLTATRRYVVHGSHLLERSGYRVIAYDARGHGDSDPAPAPGAYEYTDLVADLEGLLDTLGIERAVLVGVSMGAATTLAAAIERPERVSALVQVTPAHLGLPQTDPDELARWDALADAFEQDGVEGFIRAYGPPPVPNRFKSLIVQAIRQRLERHRHPEAVADALRVIPRSRAFDGPAALEDVAAPTLVVASRDELDPQHPYSVAAAYAERIRDAELVVEAEGESPIAWRGTRLSKAIIGFLERNP